jgi:leader peptidase (prepilin peptidase) / N-methyltransferase
VEVILAVVFFIAGACIGSFLNVVADRVPLRQSLISPPSHCFGCGKRLLSRDMVPIVSYIWLRGRCRFCGMRIPARSLVIEVCTGLLFVLALLKFGLSWPLTGALMSISIFIVTIIVDIEKGILPHLIIYPALALVLAVDGVNSVMGTQPDILSALLGLSLAAGLFLLLWGVPKLFHKNMMGFGDVGMAALIGASVGFPLVTVALYLAVLTGGLTVAVLFIFKQRKMSDPVYFGMYLALGAIGTIFVGTEILEMMSLIVSG